MEFDTWVDVSKLPAALKTRRGWSQLLDFKRSAEPQLHQIEPTNHCPYECIMCPRSQMVRKTGFMDMAIYTKVIDEVATYTTSARDKEIELFHFGESLIHPELPEMVGYGSQRGLKMVLSVNGPQFKPKLAEQIFRNHPYHVILSLDGYDDQSYKDVRGKNADFASAASNIEAASKMLREMDTDSRFTVRMINLKQNEAHAQEFKARWEKLGVNVDIREFFPWGEENMQDLGSYKRFPPGMPCPFPWQYVVVQWNGDVVPCCRDYDGVLKIGNVADGTLKEIWNGARYEWFREQHRSGNLEHPFCRNCYKLYSTPEEIE